MGTVRPLASGMPMHRQISRLIESRILNGLYVPGALIPPELRLCEEFGVSRITVRQALADLVARGLLSRSPGRGTVVSQGVGRTVPPASTGYLEDVLLLFAATQVVGCCREIVSAPVEIAAELQLAEGTPLAVITRWRALGDAPFCISSTYLDPELANQISDADLARSTFIELLEHRLGACLSGAHQVLWATTAEPDVAGRLGIPAGAPTLGMRLTYYSADNRPIAYTCTSFRGDRHAHHVRLGRVPVPSTNPALQPGGIHSQPPSMPQHRSIRG